MGLLASSLSQGYGQDIRKANSYTSGPVRAPALSLTSYSSPLSLWQLTEASQGGARIPENSFWQSKSFFTFYSDTCLSLLGRF